MRFPLNIPKDFKVCDTTLAIVSQAWQDAARLPVIHSDRDLEPFVDEWARLNDANKSAATLYYTHLRKRYWLLRSQDRRQIPPSWNR